MTKVPKRRAAGKRKKQAVELHLWPEHSNYLHAVAKWAGVPVDTVVAVILGIEIVCAQQPIAQHNPTEEQT